MHTNEDFEAELKASDEKYRENLKAATDKDRINNSTLANGEKRPMTFEEEGAIEGAKVIVAEQLKETIQKLSKLNDQLMAVQDDMAARQAYRVVVGNSIKDIDAKLEELRVWKVKWQDEHSGGRRDIPDANENGGDQASDDDYRVAFDAACKEYIHNGGDLTSCVKVVCAATVLTEDESRDFVETQWENITRVAPRVK